MQRSFAAPLLVLVTACSTRAPLIPAGAIKGSVVLTGITDASGVTVLLSEPASKVAVTGIDGAYAFKALTDGVYIVTATAPSTLEGSLHATLVVAGKEASLPVFTFTPVGQLTGMVTLGAATGNAGIIVSVPGTSSLAVTDDAGNFALSNVPVGSHAVVASHAGFTSGSSAPVDVAYGASAEVPALVLVKAVAPGGIHGRVALTNATPVAGLSIVLAGPVPGATQTDADGTYQLGGLPAGVYTVTAFVPSTTEASAAIRVTVATDVVDAPAMTFTPLGSIAGSVTLGQTTGNAGIAVAVAGTSILTVTSDSGGYVLRGVPVGSQKVVATQAGYTGGSASAVVVAYAKATTAPAIVLAASTLTGGITGMVRIPGATATGVTVSLSGVSSGTAVTDSTGAYAFNQLAPGGYTVTVAVPSTAESVRIASVTVGTAPVAAPDLSFSPLGQISGTATLGSPTGNAGIAVTVKGTSVVALTDDAGAYLLRNVPVGASTVRASAPGYRLSSTDVTVTYNAAATATALVLSPLTAPGSVAGLVRLTGATVSGLVVTLAGQMTATATTDATGAYSFTNVKAGTYVVTAVAPSTAEGLQSMQITVGTSFTAVPDLVLTPVGTILGTATLGGSTGNSGIAVVAQGTGAVAITDDSGSYTLRNVPIGARTITASLPGYSTATASNVQVAYGSTTRPSALTLSRASGTGAITGTVKLTGASAAGLSIALGGAVSASGTTDSNGTYSFTSLAAGTYTITAIVGSTIEGLQSTTVSVARNAVAAPDLVFTPLGSINGVATLGTSTGNAGIAVTVQGTSSVALTNDVGAYVLRNIPVGSQAVVASYPGYVSATAANVSVAYGGTVTAPNLALLPNPNPGAPGGIQGTVHVSGLAASGVAATLIGAGLSVAATDATGKYTFVNLADGNYTISVTIASTTEQTQSASVTVAGGVATVPDLAFTAEGTIIGRVTIGTASGNIGISVAIPGTSLTALTDDSGNFTLTHVPAGTRTIVASLAGYASVSATATVTYSATTTVSAMSLARTVLPGGVRGSITVTGAPTLTGLARITVSGPASAAGTIDATGAYSFTGLPDGTYNVAAVVASTAESLLTTSVAVSGGMAVASTLAFTGVGSITGVATLSAVGSPGITVSAVGAGSVALTGAGGTFTLKNVPVGLWTLTGSASGYTPASVPNVQVTYASTTTSPVVPLILTPDPGNTFTWQATLAGAASSSGTSVQLTSGTVFSGSATTTADGTFAVNNVPSGAVTITFSNPPYQETVSAFSLGYDANAMTQGGQIYSLKSRPIDIPRGIRMTPTATTLPTVSADGTATATLAAGTLSVQSTATGGIAVVTTALPTTGVTLLGFTANAANLLYSVLAGAVQSLYTVPATAGATPLLLVQNYVPASLVISPDRTTVAYALQVSTTYSLFWQAATGGTATVITTNGPSAAGQFTQNSKMYFYYFNNIVYGFNGTILAQTTTSNTTWTVSSDGAKLVSVCGTGLCAANFGAAIANIYYPNAGSFYNAYVYYPIISPTGTRTAQWGQYNLSSSGGYTQVLSSTPIGGGTSANLAYTGNVTNKTAFSADGTVVLWALPGNGVLYANSATATTTATTLSLVTGSGAPTVTTTALDPTTLQWLPDGHTFVACLGSAVETINAQTGVVTTLASNLAQDGVGACSLTTDGARVLYRGTSTAGDAIFSVSPSGGAATPVLYTYSDTNKVHPFQVIANRLMLSIRGGTPAPFSFQDGLYSVPLP